MNICFASKCNTTNERQTVFDAKFVNLNKRALEVSSSLRSDICSGLLKFLIDIYRLFNLYTLPREY